MSLAGAALADDVIFLKPVCLTARFHPVVQDESDPYYLLDNYRMSRNPNTQLEFNASGTLNLTYWSGFGSTNPSSPSAVYYQSWSKTRGWSANEIVDQSLSSDAGYLGQRMGGRNPSMAIDNDDKVWIAWCDYRDCGIGPPYNGINNTEIYCDWKPPGGSFSSDDLRLTSTAAAHFGDSGYAPRIQAAPDGKMSVVWYDFHLDGSISDIYLMTSSVTGVFDTVTTPMLSRRVTNADDREAIPPQTLKPAFSMPDLAISPAGQRYAVWSQGFGGSMGNSGAAPIYFAQLPEQPAIVTYEAIVPDNDGFWHPPKIKLAPNGDIWVLYTVLVETNRYVELIRRRQGQTLFDAPIRLTTSGSSKNADLAIDNEGRLHVAWSEYSGWQNSHIRYALLDAAGQSKLRETQLTTEPGAFAQPCIVLDGEQLPYIVFGEGNSDSLGASGDLWFVRGILKEQLSSAGHWMLYR